MPTLSMGHAARKLRRATYADLKAVPPEKIAEIIAVFLPEPELHFPDAGAPRGIHAVVPDLAGWRVERMPDLSESAAITIVPDWICEILSPEAMAHDRETKMPLYAQQGVRFAWLLDPAERSLEAYRRREEGRWSAARRFQDAEPVRAEPFDAIALNLALLWGQ